MTRRRVHLAFAAILGLGLLLRLVAALLEPPHHPDEVFQYLEPPWGRLAGASVETWEWREGVRSWVLPGYHGAWMALLLRFGLEGPAIAGALRAHWALVSLILVWAGWRGGALLARRLARPDLGPAVSPAGTDAPPAGWQGGLLGALSCAAFPLLVRFSVHTLSELPSILCMVFALVLSGELVERAPAGERRRTVALGVLLGLGLCLRIQHAPVAVAVGVSLLLARRFSQLGLVVVAALAPIACFGAVDWLTWGKPFSSFVGYVRFNLFEDTAALFGRQPTFWYATTFFRRLPLGLPILALFCAFGLRHGWPFVGSALALGIALSAQGHKEERFAMLGWPLLLIAAAGSAGAWLAARARRMSSERAPSRTARVLGPAAAVSFALLVLGDGALHARGNDFTGLPRERYAAQAWVGRQPSLTGLLVDQPLYFAGYIGLGRPFPQLHYGPALLHNPIVSHVLVPRGSHEARAAERAGFTVIHATGEMVVLGRAR